MTAVDTLVTLLLEDSRSVAARMAAAGFSEDEIRSAWNYARQAGYVEPTGWGRTASPRLGEHGPLAWKSRPPAATGVYFRELWVSRLAMWAALLVKKLASTKPEKRRLYAARILIMSIVGWIATHVLFLILGITGAFEHVLNLISWWAITLTAWDVLATTDVKIDTEEIAPAAPS